MQLEAKNYADLDTQDNGIWVGLALQKTQEVAYLGYFASVEPRIIDELNVECRMFTG